MDRLAGQAHCCFTCRNTYQCHARGKENPFYSREFLDKVSNNICPNWTKDIFIDLTPEVFCVWNNLPLRRSR